MQTWKPDLSAAQGPKYLAIAEALARDIDAGMLAPGDRLPPQRALADALGLDLTTVTRAYGEAQRRGLIQGNGRRGSFVRGDLHRASENVPQDVGNVAMNAPPEGFGGSISTAFRSSAEVLLSSQFAVSSFQYQHTGGASSVRQVGAELLISRGVPCGEDTVLVAAGGQNALHAIFSAELKEGDVIAVGEFVYSGLLSLARRFGVGLCTIAADGEGMLPNALDAACVAGSLKAVYIVPTNDNPTAVTMGPDRRAAVAEVVKKHRLLLIEDDAYGFLPEQPLAPISSLAPEYGWYIASVSKVLTPGLRVAWLRAPDIARAWRLAADMHETAIMAPPLNAAIVADWVRSGVFSQLATEVRVEARKRQAIARQSLPVDSFMAHGDGYHLWVPLGPEARPRQIADALRQHGLSAIPSEAFAVDQVSLPLAMRVSIGGMITAERLKRGLLLLSALIQPEVTRKISVV